MKWSKAEIMRAPNEMITFDETITFDPSAFSKMNQLQGLQDIAVSGNIHYEEVSNRVYADLDISGVMIVPCSITNEDIEYDFHTKSLETYAFEKVEDEDVHEAKGDVVELLPVIFQLILMEVPLKSVKEGLTAYPKGDGWEVVKEEEYERAKGKDIDPRLAKLKEFKIEED